MGGGGGWPGGKGEVGWGSVNCGMALLVEVVVVVAEVVALVVEVMDLGVQVVVM